MMKSILISSLLIAFATNAHAQIIAASPDHYELKQEAVSTLAPGEMWDRLIHPQLWWQPDHTFSGA
jgi:hypothetical protein